MHNITQNFLDDTTLASERIPTTHASVWSPWIPGHRKRPWAPQLLLGRGIHGLRLISSGGRLAFGGFRSLNCPHRSICLYRPSLASCQLQSRACIDECTAPHFLRTPMLRFFSDCACTDKCASPLHRHTPMLRYLSICAGTNLGT